MQVNKANEHSAFAWYKKEVTDPAGKFIFYSVELVKLADKSWKPRIKKVSTDNNFEQEFEEVDKVFFIETVKRVSEHSYLVYTGSSYS